MDVVTLIDFGSTFTKSTVISLKDREVLFTFRTPSTVHVDACIGLHHCLDAIEHKLGSAVLASSYTLASSSAAGGLRMIVVGLTDSLSMMAGKNAAYGAGAKVIKAYSGKLTKTDLDEIYAIRPEIILLCGGYEGGNSSWVLDNALALSRYIGIDAPVVYAGNSAVRDEIRLLFNQWQQPCMIADNIIPSIHELNITSTVAAVREIFMKRITHMKGFDSVTAYVGNIVMPTPAAVLEGVKLLARGTDSFPGWKQIMLADIGGATTDIHTIAPQEAMSGIHVVGSPEPEAKRTVEGDIGVRESINSLMEAADIKRMTHISGLSEDRLYQCRERRLADHDFVAVTPEERNFEQAAAMEAVRVSARRHAGRLYSGLAGTAQTIQKGKNVCHIKAIIGTGGPIIGSADPKRILQQALRLPSESDVLLPQQAAFYLDTSYIFYAAGLLSRLDKEAAFEILQQSLIPLP
jgi:uncharacterized protein (TIGR01319 family)